MSTSVLTFLFFLCHKKELKSLIAEFRLILLGVYTEQLPIIKRKSTATVALRSLGRIKIVPYVIFSLEK